MSALSHIALWAATVLLVLLSCGGVRTAAAAAPATIKHCYLFSSGVDDLGYSFSFNVARLKINSALEAAFPSSNVSSAIVQNVIRMSLEEQRDALARLVRRGCNVVVSNSQSLLHGGNYSEVSAMYPNVTFFTVPHHHQDVHRQQWPNVVQFVQVPREAFYLKGAAAARQAETCIGFIVAFEREGNPMDAVNGAVRGIRDENPTIPIHVLTMNSWHWPEGEADAARLIMSLGCEVTIRYSNPRTADLVIADEAPEPERFFSAGVHADLQQYVGDSVLVANYVKWDVGLTPLIIQVLRDGRPNFAGLPYAFSRNVVVTTELSPLSSPAARAAFERAKLRIGARPDALCGAMTLRNGTGVPTDPSTGCLTLTQQTPLFIGAPHTTFHGDFRHRGECPAGTFATYDVSPTIRLTCRPCPPDTFSASAGEPQCTPCPNSTTAEAGSTACTHALEALDQAGFDSWVIVVLVVAILFIASAAFIVTIMALRRPPANHDAAPKKPPLCILFTDIESSTELWQAHDRMGEAVETHHRVIREVLLEYGGYEVKTVGDSFMIAVAGVVDAVMIAVAIQRGLQAAEWPDSLRYLADDAALFNGLKVRIGVHYCEEVEPKYEAERDYWDYYGSDVNVAARVQAEARGGQILVSSAAVAALEAEDAYDSIVAPDIRMQVFAHSVELKGVTEPMTLYTVTPVELAARRFEPLAGYEPHAGSMMRDDQGSTTSSLPSYNGDDEFPAEHLTQRVIMSSLQRVLNRCPIDDRALVMNTVAKAWDRSVLPVPLAHQVRAVAGLAADPAERGAARFEPEQRLHAPPEDHPAAAPFSALSRSP